MNPKILNTIKRYIGFIDKYFSTCGLAKKGNVCYDPSASGF
jgi:hypothetical protein